MKKKSEEKLIRFLFVVAFIVMVISICLAQIFDFLSKKELAYYFNSSFLVGLIVLLGASCYASSKEIYLLKYNNKK